MTPVVAFLTYALLVYLLGLGFLGIISRRESMDTILKHALAFPVGMGFVLIISLGSLLLGYLINWPTMLIVAVIMLIIANLRRGSKIDSSILKECSNKKSVDNLRWYEWILSIFIIIESGYLLFATFWRPVCRNDDWVQWAGNAKYLFFQGLTDKSYFAENLRSNYPLFIASNEVTFSKLLGEWSDFACKSFLVLLVLSFALFLYRYLCKQYSRTLALAFTFVFITLPFYGEVAKDGTGEIPASLYLVLTGIFMLSFIQEQKIYQLILAAFFGGVLCGVKAEGVAALVALTTVFIFMLMRSKSRWLVPGLCILVFALLFTMPWRSLQEQGECKQSRISFFSDPEEESHVDLKWLAQTQSYLEISKTFLDYAIPLDSKIKRSVWVFGAYFYLALAYWLVWGRKDKESLGLLLMIAAVALIYAFAAYTTRWPSELRRLLTHTIGLDILFIVRQVALATGCTRPEREISSEIPNNGGLIHETGFSKS
ncbi:MAG: glycosyltransferase family 39 protein [Planctomycetes bacterium]|nr:glycosyltransferase family 39 protein [Planctomycetota bacterium]